MATPAGAVSISSGELAQMMAAITSLEKKADGMADNVEARIQDHQDLCQDAINSEVIPFIIPMTIDIRSFQDMVSSL